MEGPIAPYYELYRVHHAVNRDIFLEDMASPLMDGCRNAAEVLLAELRVIEERLLSRSAEIDLPKQVTHGCLPGATFGMPACTWQGARGACCLTCLLRLAFRPSTVIFITTTSWPRRMTL